MDFNSCTIDFSDHSSSHSSSDGGYNLGQQQKQQQQSQDLAWPPISFSHPHQNNTNCCWIGGNSVAPPPPSSFISRGNFSCYSSFMDACKREDTIEELISQQTSLKKEVLDLHRQNYMLENDKEKLINELINFGITASDIEMENEETQTTDESTKDDTSGAAAIIAAKSLIEELEAKLWEAEEKCKKLEKENGEFSEKCFEADMDKQRLGIKLHHFMQINKSLEEGTEELEDELRNCKTENAKLLEKVQKLEQKIERIEEGDFEHVAHDESSAIQTVILI